MHSFYMSFQRTLPGKSNPRTTPSGRKCCDLEERKSIPEIIDTMFRCNTQGQCMHFAWTLIAWLDPINVAFIFEHVESERSIKINNCSIV